MIENAEQHLLQWIAEDMKHRTETGEPFSVPIHMLLMRLAVMSRDSEKSLTESTELSLKMFDRATIYRMFRQMFREGILLFVDEEGLPLEVEEASIMKQDLAEGSAKLQFVCLTEKGIARAKVMPDQNPS